MYNRTTAPGPKNFIKTTMIIHLALLMGQVLFAVVTCFIAPNAVLDLKPTNDVLFYIAPALVVATMFLGSFLFKQQLSKLDAGATLQGKLVVYQTALIIRCAMSEGASLFCIVCALNTGNLFYLVVAGINIIYFIWIRPTKAKIEDSLNLDYNEKAAMES